MLGRAILVFCNGKHVNQGRATGIYMSFCVCVALCGVVCIRVGVCGLHPFSPVDITIKIKIHSNLPNHNP